MHRKALGGVMLNLEGQVGDSRVEKGWSPGTQDEESSHANTVGDFPGGAVVKNPPANAGHTGSSPGPGRSHMPRSN